MSPASIAAILMVWLARISSGDIPVNPKELSGEIRIDAPTDVPAGVPTVLHVHFTNTSTVTLRYRCYEVHAWPPACLTARLTRGGVVREVGLGNGQDTAWPLDADDDGGGDSPVFAIRSGQSSTFPVLLPPLDAGEYEIEIRGHPYVSGREGGPTVVDWPGVQTREIVRLTVRADQQAARAKNDELLKRIQQGEVLAFHIATLSRNSERAQALVPFVLNIDPRVALKAAEALRKLEPLPADAGDVVAGALIRWSYSTEDGAWQVRDQLGHVASSIGSNLLLGTCAQLARAEKSQRLHFVQVVARFPQERATQVLREFMGEADPTIRDTLLHCLADRKDGEARCLLLADLRDPACTESRRAYHILALASYAPDDREAVEAIQAGTGDPDELVRRMAEGVLSRLRRPSADAATRPAN